jgi:hypothetical protein
MRNGDVKIIKSAGALVAHPFGSIMRSLLVAVYEVLQHVNPLFRNTAVDNFIEHILAVDFAHAAIMVA